MLSSSKRKSIAKSFIYENFGGLCPELWKNYKCSDEKGYAKSWCPIPCPWVHSSKGDTAIIGVGETLDEVKEIAKAELPEERLDFIEYEQTEYVDGKKYWVMYD